eukprot:scaffold2.g7349.t1
MDARPSQAAAAVAAALALLDRGAWRKLGADPLAPDMFLRPNAKALVASLYLLYSRINGKARAAREMRHCWPLSEPGQQRDFRAFMHAWVKGLGAEGRLPRTAVQFFPTAYQTASGPRTLELLGVLCSLALEAEAERAFPGAVGDVAPDPADDAAVSSGWEAHAVVTEARRRREAAHLSSTLAALQRLQQVWHAAGREGGLGAGGVAVSGQLWSRTAVHGLRVQALQQALDSGLALSDRPEAATGAALGRLLLSPGSSGTRGEEEPSLADEATPEAVLECLVLRLAAAVQRLQACCPQEGQPCATAGELQAALLDLQLLYRAIGQEPRRVLACQLAHTHSQPGALSSWPAAQLLPPCTPPRIAERALPGAAGEATPGSSLCRSPAATPGSVRQRVWASVRGRARPAKADERSSRTDYMPQQQTAALRDASECRTPLTGAATGSAAEQAAASSPGLQISPACAPAGQQHAQQKQLRAQHHHHQQLSRAGGSPTLGDMLGDAADMALLSDIDASAFEATAEAAGPMPSLSRTAGRPQQQQQIGSFSPEESIASVSLNGGSRAPGAWVAGSSVAGGGHAQPPAMSPMASVAGGGARMWDAALRQRAQEDQQVEQGGSSWRGTAMCHAPPQLPTSPFAGAASPAAADRQEHGWGSAGGGSPAASRRHSAPLQFTPPKSLGSPWPLPAAAAAPDSATPISRFSGQQQAARAPTPPPDGAAGSGRGQRAQVPKLNLVQIRMRQGGERASSPALGNAPPARPLPGDVAQPSPRRRCASLATTASPSASAFESEESQRLRHSRSVAAQQMAAAAAARPSPRRVGSSLRDLPMSPARTSSSPADTPPLSARRSAQVVLTECRASPRPSACSSPVGVQRQLGGPLALASSSGGASDSDVCSRLTGGPAGAPLADANAGIAAVGGATYSGIKAKFAMLQRAAPAAR